MARDDEMSGDKPRGLFGRVLDIARALTAAAEPALRRPSQPPPPASASASTDTTPSDAPEPIVSVTMGELLEAQGHPRRAARIYRAVLERNPSDEGAERGLARVEARAAGAAQAAGAPHGRETHAGDEAEGVVSLPAGDAGVLVSWQVTDEALAETRRAHGEGPIVARVVVSAWSDDATLRQDIRDRQSERIGEWLVPAVPAGAHVTASLGIETQAGFKSTAHASSVVAG